MTRVLATYKKNTSALAIRIELALLYIKVNVRGFKKLEMRISFEGVRDKRKPILCYGFGHRRTSTDTFFYSNKIEFSCRYVLFIYSFFNYKTLEIEIDERIHFTKDYYIC